MTVGDGLLERDREVGSLSAALAHARAGDGALVVVEGAAGIGKTRLLDLARAGAVAEGMSVLHATGGELERDFGWGVVRQLFERWLVGLPPNERDRVLAGRAEPAAAALGVSALSADRELYAAVHGLYWLVVNIADEGRLALVIDDLQWADEPSLTWLAYLAARLERLPVALVLAVRRPDPAGDEELLRRLAGSSLGEVLRPAPLSTSATGELLAGRPALAAWPDLTTACHEATGGNPFLLMALLDELTDLALEGPPDPTGIRALRPEEITRSVLLRLGRLPREAGELARAFAVLGGAASTPRAAGLAEMSESDAAAAASALAATGILTDAAPPTFVHPLLHSAVLGDIPAPVRAALHAKAAAILRESGGGLPAIAAQLLQAEPAANESVSDTLVAAAREALREGAPQSAAVLLERALREPPSAAKRCEAHRLLGRAMIRTRGAEGVAQLGVAHDCARDRRDRVDIALEMARALEGLSRNADATAVYERALSEVPGDDTALRRVVEAGRAVAAAQQLSTLPRALELLGTAVALRDRTQAMDPIMNAMMGLALAAAGVPDGVAVAQDALRNGALLDADTSVAIGVALAPLVWGDQLDAALRLWDEVVERACTDGAPLRYAFGVTFRAEVHLRAGRLVDAEADARAAFEVPEELWGTTVPVDTPAILADALIQRGGLDEAARLLEPAGAARELSDYQGNNLVLMARGRLRLAQGRTDEAAQDLQELGSRCDAFTLRNPAAAPWRSYLAVAIRHRDRERAIALADEEADLSAAFGAARARGISLRACGLIRRGEEGLSCLREAVEVLRESPARLELARALVDLGAAERRAGGRATARGYLADGLDLAARCGAVPLMRQARAELTAAGARPRRDRVTGRDALTASELRVAKLAGEGKTNREIAEALWVTLSTVEAHLTRTYRKLDIGDRSQLQEALARAAIVG